MTLVGLNVSSYYDNQLFCAYNNQSDIDINMEGQNYTNIIHMIAPKQTFKKDNGGFLSSPV